MVAEASSQESVPLINSFGEEAVGSGTSFYQWNKKAKKKKMVRPCVRGIVGPSCESLNWN